MVSPDVVSSWYWVQRGGNVTRAHDIDILRKVIATRASHWVEIWGVSRNARSTRWAPEIHNSYVFRNFIHASVPLLARNSIHSGLRHEATSLLRLNDHEITSLKAG